MKQLPLYGMPYLEGSDKGKDIPANSLKVAQLTEAALARGGAVPIGADLQNLLARLAVLEAKPATVAPILFRRSRSAALAIAGAAAGASNVPMDQTDLDTHKAGTDYFTMTAGNAAIQMKKAGLVRFSSSGYFASTVNNTGRRSLRMMFNGAIVMEGAGAGAAGTNIATVLAATTILNVVPGDTLAMSMGSDGNFNAQSLSTNISLEWVEDA